ncbi:MipA/OmpV family protein [Thalassotalea fonticola]|uniref:MipA/OmpV family protein n=1 Tax=Thalassotalea fonticola TaxID=3065649 RepID=A0ABZ0GLK9_9GAMM|nr:MipA/OmpV family protein [Colwelliaceae bacterium S1-1]
MNNLKINKSLIPCMPLAAMIFAGASFSSTSFANDISQNLRNNTQAVVSTENYFEIGLMHIVRDEATFRDSGGKSSNSSTDLIINGNYAWNNLFIENYSESGHGIVFGYNAFNNDHWSFDLMATTDWAESSFESNGRYSDDKSEFMVGGRLSGYWGNNIVQFSLNQDASGDHDGTTASALIGRSWQYRNWNFHGIIGAEYVSAKLNDYYVGVSAETAATTSLDDYEADASVNFSTEIGVTYPITEDWVFRATARAVTRSDEITDSPKFSKLDSVATSFRTSLSYVF